ncbi:Fimbrial protein EcpC [Luteimonas sp. 9C]|uniref:pilin n=1 Tax=Luteimonas sp. 9C TaxID=2653148 RepID=UPI0012F1C088|nr:pilin [Luteimonas sp. 9C]VXB97536.1 Fimbrial protein EcpC [Luteimonas sp. 9C]
MRRTRGFTLIELMIVVAIIAILAAIGLTAYQDYVARAQVAEGFSLSSDARTAIAMRHAYSGTFPADNAAAGIAQPGSIAGPYVESVTIGPAGQIDVRLGNQASNRIAGQTLAMQAVLDAGSLHWNCSGVDARYVPSACR